MTLTIEIPLEVERAASTKLEYDKLHTDRFAASIEEFITNEINALFARMVKDSEMHERQLLVQKFEQMSKAQKDQVMDTIKSIELSK